MGVIERSIRKRSNQKLAAEVFTQTDLSFDEVMIAVRDYCDAMNAEVTSNVAASQANAKTRLGRWSASLRDPSKSHYYVSPHPELRQILIGFGQRPEPILAGKGNTQSGVWAARLSYPTDGNTVGLALIKWVINGDGVLRNRSFYENLLQNIHTAISPEAQAGEPAANPPTAGDLETVQAPPDVHAPAAPAPADAQAEPAETLIEPTYMRAGDWIADVAAQFPFLTRNEIVGLAGMRALLTVNTGYHSSSYLSQDRYTTSELYGSLMHSLLRCNVIAHNGTVVLSCGAPKPDLTFTSDWQMKSMVTPDGTAVIEVPQYRRMLNEVRNAELLTGLRDALSETLASGVHLRLAEGPPDTDDLVVNTPAGAVGYPDNDDSPFRHDYRGGATAAYRDPLNLQARDRVAVMAAISQTHFRWSHGNGDELCVVSLAGGRPFDSGTVSLRRAGENDQLLIRIPADLPPAEMDRSYRAALRFIGKLERVLKETEPELSATIGEHVNRIATDTMQAWVAASGKRPKERPPGLWLENWSRMTAAPTVPVTVGRSYPIGILATSPAQVNYVTRAAEATDWVTTFKRTKPVLLSNGKPTNRHTFTSRRCGLLHNSSDQAVPYLRFAWTELIPEHHLRSINPPQTWFWEVNARAVTAPGSSDHAGGLLIATGWSHADGVLGYGENLFALFRAFADAVSATDKQARIQTLYMAT